MTAAARGPKFPGMAWRVYLLLAAFAGTAAFASAPSRAGEPAPKAEIDRLYARLARTQMPDEAAGILGEIDHLRGQSGSDAADLLLSRGLQARASADPELALQLFDAVVDLAPDWSQGWSERATTRAQSGDEAGAMVDLAETLKREPRDVGALAGLGQMMLEVDPYGALKVYDRALKLAPAFEPLQEARARAQVRVWSRTP